MAALKNKFPGARGKEQRAFLLDHSDALTAGAVRKLVRDETVEEDAAGERGESSSD